MRKTGIGNFQLPAGKSNVVNSGRLLPHHELSELKAIASGNILQVALRAIERAEKYDCGHPFWNGLADCYIRVIRRIKLLNEIFPGIMRVIHNSEVMKGDVLVSDFYSGLNYGFMYGGTESVKIKVLEVDGDTIKGAVLRQGNEEKKEIGYFKNELWYFISHRFTIYTSGKAAQNFLALRR